MKTRIRCAKVEARESDALQGPCEGGEPPPQRNMAGAA